MVRLWYLRFCVLFLGLSVSCLANSKQKQDVKDQETEAEVLAVPDLEPLQKGRLRRKADCFEIETEDGLGPQRILNTGPVKTFKFFIQPEPGFKSLRFRGKLENIFTGTDKYSRRDIIVKSSQMKINWDDPSWIPVSVQYFESSVRFGMDKHAIRVKIGKDFEEELSTRSWAIHTFEGFTLDVDGSSKVLLNCNPGHTVVQAAHSTVEKKGIKRTVFIACVLGGCFLLLVIGGAFYLLTFGRRKTSRNSNDQVHVPASLAKGRCTEPEGSNDNIYETLHYKENIYETIDENTLAKLKQNFDVNNLSLGRNEGAGNVYENTPDRNQTDSSEVPQRGVLNALPVSLVEEKEAMRRDTGLDSPVEDHYIEMHTIVSRTSSLSK